MAIFNPTLCIPSSSSSPVQQKHHVFLSFRGEDTRTNFTSHLHEALKRKGIDTYVDYRLEKGEEISDALSKAIEESKISIIVLSKNYASSSWCLDELSKILDCRKRYGQMVVPIFYHVDPSDVRKQRGSFAEAFAEHVKKRADNVERWRTALVEVAGLAGHHGTKDRFEPELITRIVEDISKKLIPKPSNDFKGCLVGIDSRIKQIESMLVNVRILGIWGMGGIGKTTIAEAIFHRIFAEAKFECCSILTNVREKSEKNGWIPLRDELLGNILDEKDLIIGTDLLPPFIYDRLRHKRVFIVLDDVDNSMQLDLLSAKNCFGPGSKIIITSRDKQLLRNVVDKMDDIYEVEELNNNEALELFSLYAFHQNHPKQDFVKLSTKVVHYAKGVPLALKVVGSALCGSSESYWEDYLNRLKKIPDCKIDYVLRISYDRLDKEVKSIFVAIACFFKGNSRGYFENILGGYYESIRYGISVLIDKSLITISSNMLEMHDLLQQMGQNIILQESKEEPGERSWLWTPKDIYHVLKNNTGTNKVEGMLLDMSKIRNVCLSSTTFERMYNLKLLKFYYADEWALTWKWELERKSKVCLPQHGFVSLPDSLCLLHWDYCPLNSLSQNFCPDNLVHLCMRNSHIKRLWDGVQNLANLKWLDLQDSRHLIELPDLSSAIALEKINLDGCESLVGVPSSIGYLSKLTCLSMTNCRRIEELPLSIEHLVGLDSLFLNHCEKLKNLPSSIGKLKSLKTLFLRDCSNITKFPETPGNLRWLDLSGTAIEQVPSSIGCHSELRVLTLQNCAKLCSLPRNIFQLKSNVSRTVSGFSKLEVIEERFGTRQVLIANGTTKISQTGHDLRVYRCSGLDELLDDLDLLNLENLWSLKLKDCNLFAFPSRFTCISSLIFIDLSGNSFETVPASIEQLLNLERLDLSHCKNLQSLPASIGQLLNLEELHLSHCENLQLLPESIGQLLNLKELDLSYCKRLQLLPELPPNLTDLNARDCISLESVSGSFARQYNSYEFMNCTKLVQNLIWAKAQLGIQQLATENAKTQLGIQLLATEDAKLYQQKVHKNQYPWTLFSICLPGSEIPEWFSFQNVGSSVTIPLPPHSHHRKLVGLAVGFVFAPYDDSMEFLPDIDIQCSFNINGDYVYEYSYFLNPPKFLVTDHVYVHCDFKFYHHCYREIGYHPNEASFKFLCYPACLSKTKYPVSIEFDVIKKCGVHLLYAQDDLTEFSHQPSEEDNPLTIQPSAAYDPMVLEDSTTNKRTRDDYSNDEAEHKRLKLYNFFLWE